MTVRTYGLITSILFAVVGLVHLLRIIFQWKMEIGPRGGIPMWMSVIVVVVLGFLSYSGFRVAKEARTEISHE